MKKLILILLFVGVSTSSFSYELERAKVNLAHEAATCFVFYMMLVNDDVKNRNTMAKDSNFMPRANMALLVATTFSNEEVTRARVQMETKSLMKELDNDMSNFSILANRLSEPCGQLISEPEERFMYWQDKK